MIRKHRLAIAFLLALPVAFGSGVFAYKTLRWKRFAVVEQGKLYRSGQLPQWQLSQAIDRLGLKTVICFNKEFQEEERRLCTSKGVEFHYFPMPSDGLGDPLNFAQFLEIARNEVHQPVLVHCNAGVARTGAAVSLYRMAVNGWSQEKAINELRSFERHGKCEEALRRHIQEAIAPLCVEATRSAMLAPFSRNEPSPR